MSQNLSSEGSSEVRISEYAERVIRNWYVVVIAVVAAVLLVVLHTVGTGKQSQGQATVFLGTPLTPAGGQTLTTTALTNPTTAQAYLHTGSVLDKAAQAGGIKSGAALRKHLSVLALQNSTTKTTGGSPNVQITVQGPWGRKASVAAVSSLGNSLITWANRYQQAKADMLSKQIATDQATVTSLEAVLKQAQAQLKAIGRSSASSTDKATLTGSLLATISDTGDRIDQISYQMTQNEIFQSSAQNVESAGFVQQPSGGQVTASNRKSSLIVAVFAGLIVGVILALLWDAFRRRGRRGNATA
ncbi:MAG TPA: hypothetical protein VFH74_04430 [Gaiellales bacterium]|nr:hypothetical protein [Gaiellales bacterium]